MLDRCLVVGWLGGASRSLTVHPSCVIAVHRAPVASSARLHSTHGSDTAACPSF
jgi:hypothetical protein